MPTPSPTSADRLKLAKSSPNFKNISISQVRQHNADYRNNPTRNRHIRALMLLIHTRVLIRSHKPVGCRGFSAGVVPAISSVCWPTFVGAAPLSSGILGALIVAATLLNLRLTPAVISPIFAHAPDHRFRSDLGQKLLKDPSE